jgi:alpha-tubulin suppressor-like RCC1 family protein
MNRHPRTRVKLRGPGVVLAAGVLVLVTVTGCGSATPASNAATALTATLAPTSAVGPTSSIAVPATPPAATAAAATHTPPPVAPATGTVAAIEAGALYTCAVTSVGGVKCWGINNAGQLGDGSRVDDSATPVDVAGLTSGVSAVAAGYAHACAITSGGGVTCWGNNTFGMLGNGSTTYSRTPVGVSGLASGVSWIAAGFEHTCAVTGAGGVKCWGADTTSGPSAIVSDSTLTPVDVAGLTSGVTVIAGGSYHTCALTSRGGVKCWGWNSNGQLGNGSRTDSRTPVDVVGLTSGVTAIAAGGNHSCALTSAGGVKCWGDRAGELVKQLMIGTDSRTPFGVVGLTSGVIAITAGESHTCALTSRGGVKCWGRNSNGQLGNSSTTDSYKPINVVGLASGVAAISAGYAHTCAVMSTGGARCWGRGKSGELGNGSTTDSSTPVDVKFDGTGL